jgi:hypothetical protein
MIGGEGVALVELWNAAGIVKIDGFQFTRINENQIRPGFNDVLDCPDKELMSGALKRFWQGIRPDFEIDYTFDDWDLTLSDTLAVNCQTFLRNLHNHTGRILITPHIDHPGQCYWVLRNNPWRYEYPYNRWVGVKGTLLFIGSEKIAAIDIVT